MHENRAEAEECRRQAKALYAKAQEAGDAFERLIAVLQAIEYEDRAKELERVGA
jgi:hypothetical protein